MIKMPAKGLAVLATCCAMFGAARAAAPLPAQTQIVAASATATTSAAATPTQRSFTISSTATPPPDLVVTLMDLQIPSELTSAGVVVTQAGSIAGSAQLTAPATVATVSLPAASGDFTIAVFGVPGAKFSVGTFSVCVAPKSNPSNCILQTGSQPTSQSPSFTGNITTPGAAQDPTISTLSTPLTVTTAGSYTFAFTDLQFPVALNPNTTPNPSVALFQGITPIIPPGQTTPGITSGTAITLPPGQYTLLSIAQTDSTVQQGLYSITITEPDGVTTLLNTAVPVGLLSPPTRCPNSTAQSVSLTVADYSFPGPLASASALLTAGGPPYDGTTFIAGGTLLGSANSTGGAQSFAAPATDLALWTYGNMSATSGTFSADVAAGTTNLCTAAQGVGPSSGTYTYAFVWPVTTAGAYQATAADLQFPAQLSGLQFAVAQNGALLVHPESATTASFNAAVGNVVLLASAQTPTSGSASSNGLFDVNLQSTGASASLLYDKTQVVSSTGALFSAQTVTVADSANYDVNLTDLKFPAAFGSLGVVVSRGSSVAGKAFGGGTFTFAGSPGTYQLTFVASPSTDQQFGLYATSVVYSPPTITLTSNVTSAAVGASIQLTWTATNASSCSASGGNWTGNKATSTTTESVVLAATTTYMLNCTGLGGATTQSVAVTATSPPPSTKSGGGALDLSLLALCGGLVTARIRVGLRGGRTARKTS
jgi:hypothetical protein